MDKYQLMDLKETELKTSNQKEAFYRYLQIAEHHIFTENKNEGIKILKIVTALYKSFEKKREVFKRENVYTTQLGKQVKKKVKI